MMLRNRSAGWALLLISPILAASEGTHWGYEEADGPDHWGTMDPDWTLCASGRAQSPVDIDGISYLPALLGKMKQQKKHPYLYWAFYERGGKQAVRWGKWKGVRNGVGTDPNSTPELYDLTSDIGEETNVADQHPDVVSDLRQIMAREHTPSELFRFRPLDQP